ncbi:AAA family ATPase [Blautia schinkii]|nr:AAA family ATPase [Blautia schinkii]
MNYEFKEQDAYDFARFSGVRAFRKGDELRFVECPYCRGGERHDKDTFAINLRTGQFKCMRASCSQQGNMITLSKDHGFSLGAEIDEYYRLRKKYRKLKTPKEPIAPKNEAVDYMLTRGISEAVTRKYQLTVQNGKPNILVFPFFDENSQMQYVKYRKTDFVKGKDQNKEWCEPNCKPILFGMHQCNRANKTLVLTEGQIDSLSVAEAGIENAVSVPTGKNGFTWVSYCWDWLNKFDTLIVFGDCEHGEITLLEDMQRRFQGKVKAVRQQDYKGCKDANELLQKYGRDAVRRAVQLAEAVPVQRVKDLADVKGVDLFSLPKISTGIRSIDKVLSGGIYLGQTAIITGKRGDGKSTLASQILANALGAQQNVFVYSGELQDYMFKRWLNLQIAGPQKIIDRALPDGGVSYYITKETDSNISEWYRGRAKIYDNNAADDDELGSLLQIIEKSVQQYEIKLVLLDNLMTALDVGMDVDLYRAQSKFVDKLVKMAKRQNIAVVLIVHPRKNRYGHDDTDEVAGSADITNKVDIVMTYKRGKDMPNSERLLTVSKNRLTGRLAIGAGAIPLYYDEVSKRINDDRIFDFSYGWEKETNDFVPVSSDQMEIPFE